MHTSLAKGRGQVEEQTKRVRLFWAWRRGEDESGRAVAAWMPNPSRARARARTGRAWRRRKAWHHGYRVGVEAQSAEGEGSQGKWVGKVCMVEWIGCDGVVFGLEWS